jgi:6-hydroxytryprostatin B O-methyltransferase
MSVLSSEKSFDASHVASGHDWGALGEATVVDAVGSRGHKSQALASNFPSIKIIVQDLIGTVEDAEEELPQHL